MPTSKLMKCACVNKFQEKKYGKNMRIHTITTKDTTPHYRCTACGFEKTR